MRIVVTSFARLDQSAKKQLVLTMVKDGALDVLSGVREHVSDAWFTYLVTSSADTMEIFENYDASILIELAQVSDFLPSLCNAYIEHVLTIHQAPEMIYEIHTAFHILVTHWERERHSDEAILEMKPPLVRLLHWMYYDAPRAFAALSLQHQKEFEERCTLKGFESRLATFCQNQHVVGAHAWSMLLCPEWIYVSQFSEIRVQLVEPSDIENEEGRFKGLDTYSFGPNCYEQVCMDKLSNLKPELRRLAVSPGSVRGQVKFKPEKEAAQSKTSAGMSLAAVHVVQLLSHGTGDWRLVTRVMHARYKDFFLVKVSVMRTIMPEVARVFRSSFMHEDPIKDGNITLCTEWYSYLLLLGDTDFRLKNTTYVQALIRVWRLAHRRANPTHLFAFQALFEACFKPNTTLQVEFVMFLLWGILDQCAMDGRESMVQSCMKALTLWAQSDSESASHASRFKIPVVSEKYKSSILVNAVPNLVPFLPTLIDWAEWPTLHLLGCIIELMDEWDNLTTCMGISAQHILNIVQLLFTRMPTLPETVCNVPFPKYLFDRVPQVLLLALDKEHEWDKDVLCSQVLVKCNAQNRVHVEIAEKLMLPPLQLLPDKDAPGWLSWLNEKLYAPGGAGFLAIQSQHPEMNQDTESTNKRQRT